MSGNTEDGAMTSLKKKHQPVFVGPGGEGKEKERV